MPKRRDPSGPSLDFERAVRTEVDRAYIQGVYGTLLAMAKRGLIPKWWDE